MTKEQIKNVVKAVAIEQLRISETQYLTHKNHDWKELGADSLDEVELIMAFEEELGMEFDDDVAEKIRTPKQAIKHLTGIFR